MNKETLLIKGGRVTDPSQKIDYISDILVEDGKIKTIGKELSASGAEVFDAAGMIVMPGLIDMHTHLREPGNEEAETIESGCNAAAAGGFTAVCAMPNTQPSADDAGRIRYIMERARSKKARVYPVGAITQGREGKEIAEIGEMAAAGAVAFSDDGVSVADAYVMQNALRYTNMVGRVIIAHEEDPNLDRDGQMNESALSAVLGLRGMPRTAEEIMVSRDIALAEYTKTKIHITHISTKGSVDIIRAAKARGVKVTCDATPHHLTLTEDLLTSYDTRFKMNPPLRTTEDVEALVKGLCDGTIDAIATDHAPHYPENKEVEFIYASFGVTGLETALAVIQLGFVEKGLLSFADVVRKMSLAPVEILGIPGGTLKPDSPADITIYNPNMKWTVDPAKMKSRSINTAYFGREMPGKTAATIVGGVLYINE